MKRDFVIKKWFQLVFYLKKWGILKLLEFMSPILKNRVSDIIFIKFISESQFQDSLERLQKDYEDVYLFFNTKSKELALPDHLFISKFKIKIEVVPLIFNQKTLSCCLYLENNLGGGFILSSYIIKKNDLEYYYWKDWVDKETQFNLIQDTFK